MKIAAITDIGSCRQENQDNYCAQQLAGGTAWGIVCDGMGGVNGGRIAARIATDTMQQYFARHMKALQPGMEKTFIMRGFDITNRAVYEKSTSDPEMQGMGTTGVCAYASRGMAHVVHAGDSRAYLFHAGGLRQITRDHSMVQQLVDSGQITREQAAVHPQKNLITRALGVSANIVPEYNRCEIEAGDILLLCTDGLTNMVADDDIAQVLREVPFLMQPAFCRPEPCRRAVRITLRSCSWGGKLRRSTMDNLIGKRLDGRYQLKVSWVSAAWPMSTAVLI